MFHNGVMIIKAILCFVLDRGEGFGLLGCLVRGPSRNDVSPPPEDSPTAHGRPVGEQAKPYLAQGHPSDKEVFAKIGLNSSSWFPFPLDYQFLRLTNFWEDIPSGKTYVEWSNPQAGHSLNSCHLVPPITGEGSEWYRGCRLWPLEPATPSDLEPQFYHLELIYLVKQVISSHKFYLSNGYANNNNYYLLSQIHISVSYATLVLSLIATLWRR